MKSSPVSLKKEAMSKNMQEQRTAGRKIREKYSSYIYRVLKENGQEPRLDLSTDLMTSIASEAARLCLYNKRRTITRREVETAMKNVLSGGSLDSFIAS